MKNGTALIFSARGIAGYIRRVPAILWPVAIKLQQVTSENTNPKRKRGPETPEFSPLLPALALRVSVAQLLRRAICSVFWLAAGLAACGDDFRNFQSGHAIPHESYCDQPYIVVTKDGRWLCLMTTGPGKEGTRGQHIVATISKDQGRTWSKLIDIEPSDGPAASWVVPLVTPGGRVYAFYTYNGDRIETLNEKPVRVDTLGWFVYKYSDDGGRTWSADRYRLPMRVTSCDRANDWQGKVQLFWGIDKPICVGPSVLFGFTKLGKHHMENGEGWLFRCDNLLGQNDPGKVCWKMLPDGDEGIRARQFGSCQEEHNMVALSGDDLYCIYRTDLGFPCHSYSRDGGRSWTSPEPATYTPGGRTIRHPRACPMLWQAANGKYLLWYQNNGVTKKSKRPDPPASPRNLVWLTAGEQRNGYLHWCQPELVCYCPNPLQGCSYPDLIEDGGHYYFSSTQKTEARVQAVDPQLLGDLWYQNELRTVAQRGCVLSVCANRPIRVRPPCLACRISPKGADSPSTCGSNLPISRPVRLFWIRVVRAIVESPSPRQIAVPCC